MALDYANERWIRVYTRDTVTIKLLSWQARALLWELLRKADRAGVIDVGEDGAAGIAALVSMPLEVASVALSDLLERGVIRGGDGCYVFPNFLEAQESKRSDAERQRRARETKRALAMSSSVTDHVTRRDASVTKRDAGERNPVATVTAGHIVSLLDKTRQDETKQDKEREATSPPAPPRKKRNGKGGHAPGPEASVALELWSEQDRLRLDAIPGCRALKPDAEQLARVEEAIRQHGVDDCRHVLAVYAAEARLNPDAARWFDGVSNWRPENINRARGRALPTAKSGTRDIRYGSAPPSEFIGVAPGEHAL